MALGGSARLRLLEQMWHDKYHTIVTNAGSLFGSTLVTSGLGFVFWWVAARFYPTEAVGLANAIVATMLLLSSASILGLDTLLISELAKGTTGRSHLIATGALVVGLAGGSLGLLFAAAAPLISAALQMLHEDLLTAALFAAGVSLTSITYVLDQALVGLLRGGQQLWRNTVFAAAKLMVLVYLAIQLPSSKNGFTIYAAWLTGLLISLVPLLWTVISRRRSLFEYLPQKQLLTKLSRPALAHYLLNLSLQYPTPIFPLIVAAMLSTRMTAYFYAAWMIAGLAIAGLNALTTVLFAVGSANPATLASRMRITLGASLLLGVVTNLAIVICGNFVLRLFGSEYAVQGGPSLQILGLALFPLIVRGHYTTHCRIERRLGSLTTFMLVADLAELLLAILGLLVGGLTGFCAGWVIAVSFEAAIMLPSVFRAARAPMPTGSHREAA